MRQLVRFEFQAPPFTACTTLPACDVIALLVHSQTFPHMSTAPQAASVFAYCVTGVVPLFSPQLKSDDFGTNHNLRCHMLCLDGHADAFRIIRKVGYANTNTAETELYTSRIQ